MAKQPDANGMRGAGVQSRRLIVIAWLFSAIIVLVLAFTYYGIGLLSATRGYVAGEGLWSKAQKDMVFALARYARYHHLEDYQAYRSSLAVSLGDRQARIELDKTLPDLQLARAGLLQGRNHPDDLDGMIRLFRNFRHVPDIEEVIDIWRRADLEIDQLMVLAEQIHRTVQAGKADGITMLPYLQQLHAINQRLRPLEDAFSYTLGVAARKTQTLLLIVLFTGVSALLVSAFMFSRRLIGQSERLEAVLRNGEQQLRSLLQSAPLPIIIVRLADEAILFANVHAMTTFKLITPSLDHLRARDFYVKAEDRERLVEQLRAYQAVNDWEVRLQDAQGMPFWASMSSQCINFNGQPCVLSAVSDIEMRKRNQQELQRRAFYDELTGLPNRAMFKDALENLLMIKERDHGQFALFFIDMDHFKAINDEHGHDAGDRLLQELARRLKACLPASDIIARLGGDEFVALVDGNADATQIELTGRAIMAAMVPLHQLGDKAIHISVSIGISCYPRDGCDSLALMKNADAAMYRAKVQGRNNFQCYGDGPAAAGTVAGEASRITL